MKTRTRTTALTLLAALTVAGVIAAAVTTDTQAKTNPNAKPRINSEITTTPKTKMTSEERRNVSIAAGRILKHVQQARDAVTAKDAKKTREQVAKGLILADIIEKVRPSYEVTAKITAGDLVYEDKDEVNASVITLYEELDDVSVISPVIQEQKDAAAAKAKAASKSPGNKSAGKTADENAPPAYVGDAEFDYTSVKLDIALAKAGLKVAQSILKADKNVEFDRADEALATVQRSVIFEFVEIDEPLQRARTNLGLAKTLLNKGNWKAAKASLQMASDSLQVYGDDVEEHRSKEVASLKKEIDKLIAKEKQEENAAKVVEGWWDRVTKWFH